MMRKMAVAALAAAGCAVNPVPREQLAGAEAAIAAAIAAGAAQHAARELQSAREKIALSKRWIASGDYEPASWLAEQALVDAELAKAKALRATAPVQGR
jgi:hypothetical protein